MALRTKPDAGLTELMSALRSGRLCASDLWSSACEAHAERTELLNAYRTWNDVHAGSAAECADLAFRAGMDLGPLQGIPISLKDVYGVSGMPIFAGSPKPLPESWARDGSIVHALRQQFAIVTGKTHTVQFAFGGVGTNCHQPTPRNPWSKEHHRVPGGSSAGAAVSLHEGSAVVALGTDTAGSVRIPASLGGVVGLKTTVGRWPRDGIVPLSRLFDSPGVLCRSVEDLVIAVNAIESRVTTGGALELAERDLDLKRFTLGIPDSVFWDSCGPGIAESVKDTVEELGKRGLKVFAVEASEATDAYDIFRQGATAASELLVLLKMELPEFLEMLDPKVADRVNAAHHTGSVDLLSRMYQLENLGRAIEARFDAVDALVCPTIAVTPPTVAEVAEPDDYREWNMAILRNTSIVNMLGLCALTIPAGLDSSGMPVGLQLIAKANDEHRLLALGQAVEKAIGTPRARLGLPPLLEAA